MHDTEFNGQNLTVEIAGQRRKSKGPQADDICRRCRRKGHWYFKSYVGKIVVLKEGQEEEDRIQVQAHQSQEIGKEFFR